MRLNSRKLLIMAAIFGFSGVALGAFGAHALRAKLESADMMQTWAVAVDYHSIYSLGLLVLGIWARFAPENIWIGRIFACWAAGTLLFSGSLYGLALGGSRLLGPVTPIGGVLLMAGWLLLIAAALHDNHSAQSPSNPSQDNA